MSEKEKTNIQNINVLFYISHLILIFGCNGLRQAAESTLIN